MQAPKQDNKAPVDQDQIETTDLVGAKKSCFEQCSPKMYNGFAPVHTEGFKTIHKKDVFLHLFSSMLVRSHEKSLVNTVTIGTIQPDSSADAIKFTPSLAFYIKRGDQANRKYSAIKFVDMDTKKSETFYHMTLKVVNFWAGLLANYMNQIGVQQYFRTIRMLGKGVSAEVHLAERISDGKHFAIKVFNKLKNNKKCQVCFAQTQDAFENEIKTLRILNHPNIMKLYNVFVSSEFIYAVLEFLPGGTLFEEVKRLQSERRKYQKQEEYRICHNLVSALQHLRIKRIVHRDLKLENILIRPATTTEEKGYVLCDFGLATWIDEQSYIFEKCGTPGYIAPEILRAPKGEKIKIDCKADIFSLGCIIHVVFLTRTVFHYSGDCKNLLKQNKLCQIDFGAKRYDSLSQDQLELLQEMLNQDAKDRFSSELILKMSYFRKGTKEESINKLTSRASTQRDSEPTLSYVPKTIIRSTDRMGSVEVKEDRKATFTRNASLNKNVSFTEGNKPKSSIFNIFSRSKVTNVVPPEALPTPADIKLRLKDTKASKKEIIKDMLGDS